MLATPKWYSSGTHLNKVLLHCPPKECECGDGQKCRNVVTAMQLLAFSYNTYRWFDLLQAYLIYNTVFHLCHWLHICETMCFILFIRMMWIIVIICIQMYINSKTNIKNKLWYDMFLQWMYILKKLVVLRKIYIFMASSTPLSACLIHLHKLTLPFLKAQRVKGNSF